MHQAHLVDLWWWQLGGPPVHGPLDNVLRRASPIIFLSTIPGLPTGREELDGGVAPDLGGEGVKESRIGSGESTGIQNFKNHE